MHNIIPKPAEYRKLEGIFNFNKSSKIIISDNDLRNEAELLKNYLTPATGFDFLIAVNTEPQKHDIFLEKLNKKENYKKEEYTIEVSENNVKISSPDNIGVIRGIQTLRQLLPIEIFSEKEIKNLDWSIPSCEIRDYPQFTWRGMHLDVSRHFFTKDEVKRFIEQIAIHKFNILHLHLTDDQGWRIEIKKYPKLTEKASIRPCTVIGHERNRPRVYDNTPHGGFYTQEDMKDIIDFAAKRHITIVPEIDMPGHMQAAIHAYPELGCNNLDAGIRCHWGISQHILNPFDSTINFMKDVLSEIIEIFPSEFIHIGGDEAHKHEWCETPAVQKKMHEVGAKSEDELQSWFIRQMDNFITSKGRRLIGWDEILEGGLADNAAVMSWRSEEGGIQAAKMKHDVVMATKKYAYLDYYQKESTENEPLAIGGLVNIETSYSWNPVPEELRNTENSKYVLGGQGQLWTEYMENRDKLDYMAFPRTCALSEALWSTPENKNYTDFSERINAHKNRMDILKINYCK